MLIPNSHIQKLIPVAHGGRLYKELSELGLNPDAIIDFSVSTNPCGQPPYVRDAVAAADLESYPDSDSNILKNRLAGLLGIDPVNLIVGNGSTELIRLAADAYLGKGDRALIPQPTYGEYEMAVKLTGAHPVFFKLPEKNQFRFDPDRFLKSAGRGNKAVFLCNPNNPTGEYLSHEVVERLAAADPDRLLVLDEAYAGFVKDAWSSADLINYPNLLIIRSMTKDYAMAGVRLGYAFAHESIIRVLEKIKPPWSVSSMAQAAGLFVLDQNDYRDVTFLQMKQSGDFLKTSLEKLGLHPLPSCTNFFLVKVGRASMLRRDLLKKGFLVRDCTSFGLPEYIRISYRRLGQCKLLVKALQDIGVQNYDG